MKYKFEFEAPENFEGEGDCWDCLLATENFGMFDGGYDKQCVLGVNSNECPLEELKK